MADAQIIRFVADFALILTLVVYIGIWNWTRKSSLGQNFIALVNVLSAESLRSDREVLCNLHALKIPWSEWNVEEKKSASRVCSGYDLAGIMIKHRLVGRRIVIDNWGRSIITCYEAAKDHISNTRLERSPKYWDDFEWLANICDKHSIQSPHARK